MRHSLSLLAILALAACGKADNASGPGGVTIGEARALDEAAEVIESRRMPPEALASAGVSSAPDTVADAANQP